MSQNPFNLGLRFALELALLVALSFWGWDRHSGWLRYVLVIGLPLAAGLLWGVFRVPEDASANGEAPVPVPGWLRLLLELALFGFATWCLFDAGAPLYAALFGGITLLHYLLSYDRLAWLLGRKI
jgi:hypothetical protein